MGVPALVGVESTQSVLVWSTGDFGGGTGAVASWLCASGESDSASFFGRDTGVTIDALGPSDEVLFFTNGRGDPNNGDVRADFADTGKRLVLATFSWADQGSNTLGGRMINEGINPLVAQGSTRHSGVSIASADGSLRWDGVAYQRLPPRGVLLTPGSRLRGGWTDGTPLRATRNNVIGVDLFPDDTWGGVAGAHRQLFIHAIGSPTQALSRRHWRSSEICNVDASSRRLMIVISCGGVRDQSTVNVNSTASPGFSSPSVTPVASGNGMIICFIPMIRPSLALNVGISS